MTVYQILAIVFFGLAFIALVVTVILFFNLEIVRVIGDLSGITAKKQIEQIRTQTTNISYGAHKRVHSNHNVAIDNMLVNAPASDSGSNAQSNESRRSNRRRGNVPAAEQISDAPVFDATPTTGTVSLDSINATDTLKTGRTNRLKHKTKRDSSEAETDVLNSDISEMPTDVLSDETEVPTDILDDNIPTDVLADGVDVTEMPTGVLNPDSAHENSEDYEEDDAPTGILEDDTDYDATSVLSDDVEGTTVLSNNEEERRISFNIVSDETVINTDEVIN